MDSLDIDLTVQEALGDAEAEIHRPIPMIHAPTAKELDQRIKGYTKHQLGLALYYLADLYLGASNAGESRVSGILEWMETGRFNGKQVDATLLRMELEI